MAKHLLPNADSEGNIGHSLRKWNEVHVGTIEFKDGTNMSTNPISATGGSSDIVSSYSVQSSMPSKGASKTFSHGQGKVPMFVKWCLVCLQSEKGFSVGERLYPGTFQGSTSTYDEVGLSIYFNPDVVAKNTGMRVTIGDDGILIPSGLLTLSKWNLRITFYFRS